MTVHQVRTCTNDAASGLLTHFLVRVGDHAQLIRVLRTHEPGT